MTEPLPEEEQGPEPGSLPSWIPVLIGGVLVILAGLAVYTGLHFRDEESLTTQLQPRRRPMTTAPPGEPGAGASQVLHGESGENTPAANAPVTGEARAVITGDASGVQTTARIWARRGMVLNVLPDDSMVYVNDVLIGQVRQFNTMDEIYDFAEPGSYTVKIIAPNGTEKTYIITAGDEAKEEVARISAKL